MKRRVDSLMPREAFVYERDVYILLSTDVDRSGRLPVRHVGYIADDRVMLFIHPNDTVIYPETEVQVLEHKEQDANAT